MVTEREFDVTIVKRTHIEWRDRVEWGDREAKRWRTITREVPVPVPVDGGVQVVIVRETVTEAATDRSSGGTSSSGGTADEESVTELHEKTRTAPALRSWRVGLQIGVSWATPSPAVPGAGPLVLGVTAEFRVPLERLLPRRPSMSGWVAGQPATGPPA